MATPRFAWRPRAAVPLAFALAWAVAVPNVARAQPTVAAAGLVAAGWVARVAPAAAPTPSARAKRHFDQGAALYEDGDLTGARFEFEQAYRLSNNHRILYNIAVVLLELHDYAGAKRSFERYLSEASAADGGASLAPERRAEVEAELEGLEGRVGDLSLVVDVDGAIVMIDGDRTGQTPLPEPLSLNLGAHTLRVEAAGFQPFEQQLAIEGGAVRQLSVALVPVAAGVDEAKPSGGADDAAGSREESSQSPSKPARSAMRLRTATWVTLGTAAGAGTAGLVTGLLALRAENDLEREHLQVPPDVDAVDTASTQTRQRALATDVLLGVAGVAAVAALGLGIAAARAARRSPESSGRRARLHTGPGGIGVRF